MNRALQVLLQRNAAIIRPMLAKRSFSVTAAKQSDAPWLYRESSAKYLPKKHLMLCEAIGAVMWYWMLIHLWHEPEHIFGDFPFPDPSKWTNEELGIPPA